MAIVIQICSALLILQTSTVFCGSDSIFDYDDPVEYNSTSETQETLVDFSKRKGCGWRQNDRVSSRVTGSMSALFGEFPWAVAVFIYNAASNEYQYHCVGSLIHPQVVLTAAHRFLEPARIRVRAGEWDLRGDFEILYHQSSDVECVMAHANFNRTTLSNDVALLFLETAIRPAAHIGYACLPDASSTTPPGERCVVTGWGLNGTNGSSQQILKMVQLPTVKRSKCNSMLRKVNKYSPIVDSSMLCAGGKKNEDACVKDGGAPLVCPYENGGGRYFQAGIVSWGIGCGLQNVPGVYTDVSSMRNWIDDAVHSKGYTTYTYTV